MGAIAWLSVLLLQEPVGAVAQVGAAEALPPAPSDKYGNGAFEGADGSSTQLGHSRGRCFHTHLPMHMPMH